MEKNSFLFGRQLEIFGDERIANSTIHKLWQGFCFQSGELIFRKGENCQICTGKVQMPELPLGKEYVISVTTEGFAITAIDPSSLTRALMVLMMHIKPVELTEGKEQFQIEGFYLEGDYQVKRRMIHLCVFPETTMVELKKYIRLAGVLQYTHIILEFWGMLRYDCLRELAWEHAYTKAEVKALVEEIEQLGMEAIPMFNHLGHAAGSREGSGKHVALDQNPKLATLFTGDGWSWEITNPAVHELLAKVRRELYELFPNTNYIHLGCDEVYSYEDEEDGQKLMQEYLHELTESIIREGRRPIIWGDMLLNKESCEVEEPYYFHCKKPEYGEALIKALAPETVIADWQYEAKEIPLKTSMYLKGYGFEVLGASWFDSKNCKCHIETICNYGVDGLMVTTWHTVRNQLRMLVNIGKMSGAHVCPWFADMDGHKLGAVTATLLRKVYFAEGVYQNSGWIDQQIYQQLP